MNKFIALAVLASVAVNVQGGIIKGILSLSSGSSHHGEEKNVDYYAHPKYEFKYGVEDHHTGDIKNQEEHRDGDNVHGHYTVAQPDGTTRVVSYHADKHSGFNADVKILGHPIETHTASQTIEHHGISSGHNHESISQYDIKQHHPTIIHKVEEHHEISHQPEIHHEISHSENDYSSGHNHESVSQYDIKQYHPTIIHKVEEHHEISHQPEIHHEISHSENEYSSGNHHDSVSEYDIKQYHPTIIHKVEEHHSQPIEHHSSVTHYETEQHHPINHNHDSHNHHW